MAHNIVIRERITAIIGVLLLCLLVAGSYYYSLKNRIDGLRYVPSESSPDFRAKDIVLTDFDGSGAAKQRLSASGMEHFSDGRMHADGARYYSLNPEKPQFSVKSDNAQSKDNLATIELSGHVEILRAAQAGEPALTLHTEYLRGNLDTYEFDSNRPVTMTRGKDITKASGGMKYNNISRTVELDDRVHSVFQPTNDTNSSLKGRLQ